MKKIIFSILSFIFIVAGGNFISSAFFADAEETTKIINISSVTDFVNVFGVNASGTYNGVKVYDNPNVCIKLSSPLDFSETNLSSIYSSQKTFKGTFDGNGKTISNITLTSSTAYYGLIPYAKDATIQNLRISGNVGFDFDNNTLNDIYVGVLVGYGDNVTIKNCELDGVKLDEKGKSQHIKINEANEAEDEKSIPVDVNLNFGFLAGKLKNNPNTSNLTMPANVVNCVNYYDVDFQINKYKNISVGGLVGVIDNGFMLNNMNFGKIIYSKDSSLNSTSDSSQYFGGLVGRINGSKTHIRNNIFDGKIESNEDVSGLKVFKGGILGGILSNSPSSENINFDYYTQDTQSLLNPSGDNFVETKDKVKAIGLLTKEFLETVDNFDEALPSWNFKETWMLVSSRYRLQNFQTFDYSFSSSLDDKGILESAKFLQEGSAVENSIFKASYGIKINIKVMIKENYQGYYYINKNTDFILLNNNKFKGDCQLSEIVEDEKIVGYIISIQANANTAGEYSFFVSQKNYNCQVSISDEAKELSQGGVRVQSNSSSNSINEFNITFAYTANATEPVVIAEGKDIYNFDHWELFYKDAEGNFTLKQDSFDQDSVDSVKISFGKAPFDREFKLVAFFTDEESIKIDFGKIDNDIIKTISLGGQEYLGEKISIAPSRVVKIEVTTQKNYLLNVEDISLKISDLYGDKKSPYPVVAKEASTNESGETSYEFYLDLKFAKDKIKNNALTLKLETNKNTKDNGSKLLWLYITLPVLAVIGIGLAIFFIVRKKNGGGKVGGKNTQKQKSKSYKDYYM